MDDQIKALMDYTKFHIGMYTTLIAGIIGLFSNSTMASQYAPMLPYVRVAIVMFFTAGVAGGLVASSIPGYKSWETFQDAHLGPWGIKWIKAKHCAHIEHSAFWLGSLMALVGLLASTWRL